MSFFSSFFGCRSGEGRDGKPGVDIFLLIWFQLVSFRSCGLEICTLGFNWNPGLMLAGVRASEGKLDEYQFRSSTNLKLLIFSLLSS